MNGLSIGMAVVGLAQAAAQIVRLLSGVADAPSISRDVIAEVGSMEVILRLLETFVLGSAAHNEDRTSLVRVDDLVTILTSCVCAFSELHFILDGCDTSDPDATRVTLWDRARWAAK